MLNDLLAIERRIAAYEIALTDCHPDVKDMAKGPAFRVRLSPVGAITGTDLILDAGRGRIWTLRDGQHNGFPGLKTTSGLLALDAQLYEAHQRAWETDKTSTGRRDELLRLVATTPVNGHLASSWPNAGHRKRIAQRLASLRSLASDPLAAAVPAVFERFLMALETSPTFVEALLAALTTGVRNRGDEWLEPVRTALLSPAALAIDIPDIEFARDATDARQIGPVSAALGAQPQDTTAATEHPVVCSLSGRTGNLHSGNFPQPNLPGLGQTYIFARNRDIPSLARYGRTADASFPIDAELVRRLSGVISALTQEDRRGSSWRLIPAETGDKPDLLVTSLAEAGLADALAGDEDDDTADGDGAWSEFGKRLIRQTQGKDAGDAPLEHMVILVLRTVDPANRKAIFHRNTTTKDIWNAAQLWQSATANIPDWLGFVFPVRGKRAPVFRTAPFVKPLSLTPLSRVQFANGGQRRVPVIGVTAATAFSLFLQEGELENRARRILRLLLQRHGTLLSGLAAARVKGTSYLKNFDPKADLRRDALRSATWIGVLLYQLGRFKEIYMSDVGFRLGQLLAAMDVVHIGYCTDVRGGDVPMNLIGNSVFAIAGSNPEKALSILQGRWKPYEAWAKPRPRLTEKIEAIFRKAGPLRENAKKLRSERRDEEASKLERQASDIEAPGWAMRNGLSQASRVRPFCAELAENLKQVALSDAFRAELLLGYMAGPPPLKA